VHRCTSDDICCFSGWHREVVYRTVSANVRATSPPSEICYFSPEGTKLVMPLFFVIILLRRLFEYLLVCSFWIRRSSLPLFFTYSQVCLFLYCLVWNATIIVL